VEAGSHHDAGMRAMPGGSPSVSIGFLWLDINKLDEGRHEGTSTIVAWGPHENPASHSQPDSQRWKRAGEVVVCSSGGGGH
jgi:hypothetical protein